VPHDAIVLEQKPMVNLAELPTETVHLRWVVLEAGADGRSLAVQYLSTHRAWGPARVRIRESQSSIAISVEQRVVPNSVDVRQLGIAFTASRRTPIEEAALRAPIGGSWAAACRRRRSAASRTSPARGPTRS